MAGGMQRRADASIADRVAAMRGATTDPSPSAAPTFKHCWVLGDEGRLPGLLLAWEQRVDGWHGRVVHAVPDAAGWIVVEEWLPAGVLTST